MEATEIIEGAPSVQAKERRCKISPASFIHTSTVTKHLLSITPTVCKNDTADTSATLHTFARTEETPSLFLSH